MLQCSGIQASTCPLDTRLASGRRLRQSALAGVRIPSVDGSRLPQRHRQQLQTCAAKGKGKQGMRQGMGAQKMGPQMPAPPPVDPDNVEFILFVRNPKLPDWWPVTIVKGGRPANLLVGTMDSEWGKKLFGKALIRSISQPLWKYCGFDEHCHLSFHGGFDEYLNGSQRSAYGPRSHWQLPEDKKKIEQKMRKEYPPLKTARELEWGFKIRDKTKPNTAFAPENLTVLPGEKDLEPTLGEQVATWFRGLRK